MNAFIRTLFFVGCFIPVVVRGESCLRYSGALVFLEGSVTLRTFFGPPDWSEEPKSFKTSSLETQAILKLDTPICVDADPAGNQDAQNDQKEVTLVLYGKLKSFSPYVSKHVAVEGNLQ